MADLQVKAELRACKDFNRSVQLWCKRFILYDFIYFLMYCGIIGMAIAQRDETAQIDGFLALSSPHVSIIPTLVSILGSANAAIAANRDGVVKYPTLDNGWFLLPLIAIPFDALETAQSFYNKPIDKAAAAAFSYGLAGSVAITAYTLWLYYSLCPASCKAS